MALVTWSENKSQEDLSQAGPLQNTPQSFLSHEVDQLQPGNLEDPEEDPRST